MEQSMTRIAAGQRTDALAERDWDANDPAGFRKLESGQQIALVDWIRAVLVPAKSIFRRNSYGMKHDFAREPDGFYVKNGAFKGAMLTAGFRPVDEHELNWRFRVKAACELSQWEQAQRRVYGRGWLVRNRCREKGFEILQGTQRQRAQEHSQACWQEQRPKVVVLLAKHSAQVTMDTEPAGCRLTRQAVGAVLAIFEEFDPKGRKSYVVNEKLVVIRRVPVWRAEEVAAALVKIAKSCQPPPGTNRAACQAETPTAGIPQ